jgi:hypothetical protein
MRPSSEHRDCPSRTRGCQWTSNLHVAVTLRFLLDSGRRFLTRSDERFCQALASLRSVSRPLPPLLVPRDPVHRVSGIVVAAIRPAPGRGRRCFRKPLSRSTATWRSDPNTVSLPCRSMVSAPTLTFVTFQFSISACIRVRKRVGCEFTVWVLARKCERDKERTTSVATVNRWRATLRRALHMARRWSSFRACRKSRD